MPDFSTTYLLGMLSALDRPRRFLLEVFFPAEVTFDTQEIAFDKLATARRLAPFVSPLVAGRVMRIRGGEVKSFAPAYVKPKHILSPDQLLKRKPGEALNGNLSPEQRRTMIIEQTLQDQDDQISRREEWMASAIVRTGKVVVEGEDYPKQEVDFGRAAGHTVALTGGNRWGETGVKVLESLRTWGATVSNASGHNPRQVIMDPLAANLLLADAEIKEILNNRRQAGGQMQFAGAVTGAQGDEVAYLGSVGQFEFWQYQQVYHDDAGAAQKMLPDYTVIMGSPGGVEGVRAYGAIQDMKVLRALPRFPKMWEVDDPSVEYMMTQSAPLPVPRQPDATFCATVR